MTSIRAVLCTPLIYSVLAVGAQAVQCSSDSAGQIQVTSCRVDLWKEKLELFWNNNQDRPYRHFAALKDDLSAKGKVLVFAMNGGMYDPGIAMPPTGLFIAEGRELRPINLERGQGNFYVQPNGVFLVDRLGARVVTTDEYIRRHLSPMLASQSGPILVARGKLMKSDEMAPDSHYRKIRNGVCAPTAHEAVFVISSRPITFYELATYFRSRLHCRDALYLDGNISSLYTQEGKWNAENGDLGTIFAVIR